MNGSTSRMFTLLGLVVGVWIITYWLYEPSAGPRFSVDTRPAAVSRLSIIPRSPLAATSVTEGPISDAPIVIPEDRSAEQGPGVTVLPNAFPRETVARMEARPRVIAPQFRDAVVQRGDTSWQRIARRELGNEKLWPVVARANPFVTSDRLIPGKTVLKIPLDPENIQGKPAPAQDAPGGVVQENPVALGPEASEHTIQPDETLWSISKKYYGRGGQWKAIYDANREAIRDPDRPPVGTTIRIPPAPRG